VITDQFLCCCGLVVAGCGSFTQSARSPTQCDIALRRKDFFYFFLFGHRSVSLTLVGKFLFYLTELQSHLHQVLEIEMEFL
jgi:hypothetical protein